jgi:hypothetical protein
MLRLKVCGEYRTGSSHEHALDYPREPPDARLSPLSGIGLYNNVRELFIHGHDRTGEFSLRISMLPEILAALVKLEGL